MTNLLGTIYIKCTCSHILKQNFERISVLFAAKLCEHRIPTQPNHDDYIKFDVYPILPPGCCERTPSPDFITRLQKYVDDLCKEGCSGVTGEDSCYDSDYETDQPINKHQDVSRTTSDTLAAEYADYVQTNPIETPSTITTTPPTTTTTTTKNGIDNNAPAVIQTESVHVNLERSISNKGPDTNNVAILDPKPLRTVELPVATVEPIRQGFSNGDIIVTLLPVNTRLPWLTPAQFRPELVPEELMAQGLTLTVEEYVQAMELLVNDVRFTLYNVCYKRVLVVWITLAFVILIGLLFSGQAGLTLFGLGIGWLILNAGAIFLSMWLKYKLSRNLERCLAHVNKQLLRHKIVLALDDRGKISCHKVNLCFIFMDSGPCIANLQTKIEQQERADTINNGWEQRMDITASDIVIQGSRTTRLSRKQSRAEQLFLRYLQRWGKDFLRRRLDWTLDETLGNPSNPLHINSSLCPCQYIEELLANKPPRTDIRDCCPLWSRFLARRGMD